MAIKHGSKVDKSFSASSMTDLMFLLLLFLLIATTLINPNALKLMLPKSSNQLKDKAMTTVSIQDAGHGKYRYYVELQEVGSIEGVERALKTRLDGQKDATALKIRMGERLQRKAPPWNGLRTALSGWRPIRGGRRCARRGRTDRGSSKRRGNCLPTCISSISSYSGSRRPRRSSWPTEQYVICPK